MKFSSKNIDPKTLFIGIDGGGSKCKAKLVSADGSIQGTGLSGRANPVQGLERTIESITESSINAMKDANLSDLDLNRVVAGVGLAGVNLPFHYTQVNNWSHPFQTMFLTTDLHIACLGAHAYQDGSVIIAGTGSCGISIVNGQSKIYGAHGFPIGDQCSGAWIGLKAVSAVLLAAEELGPDTSLVGILSDYLGIVPLRIAEKMLAQPPKVFAKLAPLVIEEANRGDDISISIITEGAGYIDRLASKILKENPGRLSLIGGLRPKLVHWLSENTRSSLSEPILEPEDGALSYAKTQFELAEHKAV